MVKNWISVCLVSLLLIAGSVSVSAAPFSISGDYVSVDEEGLYTGDLTLTGFVLSAEGTVFAPFGLAGTYESLTTTDPGVFTEEYELTRYDLLASYEFPIAENFTLKVLGGYSNLEVVESWKTMQNTLTSTFSGPVLGASIDCKVVDKLNLRGSALFGVGMEVKGDESWWAGAGEDEADFASYRISGGYDLMPNVALEAGYRYDLYESDIWRLQRYGDKDKLVMDGYFVGVRASF